MIDVADKMALALWPEGAPYALGNEREDQPVLVPYFAANQGVGKQAAVIVFPGGGYSNRADHEGEPIAQWLNALGITAFVLEYRVAPYGHPVQQTDGQRALRYVRSRAEEWNLDPGKLGVIGFSAGGHLASTVGTRFDNGNSDAADFVERFGCRPDFLMLCYPVISMGPCTHEGSRRLLLGEQPGEELIALLSNERQVTEDTPPTFLWHTADDSAVPVDNALLFAGALQRNKVPFELHVFQSGRHGLGLAADHPEAYVWPELCARWLKRREIID